MRRLIVGIAAILFLAGFATACGGDAGGGGNDPIKIGVVIPLSGGTADVGEQVRGGYDLAAEEINQDGGINGRQVEFVYADHTGNPATGAREARRLVSQEGVIALTGSYESGVTLVVAQTAEQLQVPYLVPYSSATSITNSGFRYTFRTRPALPTWSQAMVGFLQWQAQQNHTPVSRIGLLVDGTEYGQTAAEAYRNAATAAGMTVVGQETFEQGTTNLAPQLAQLRAAGTEAILASSYLQSSTGALRTMDSLNYRVPYMTVGTGIVAPGFFDLGPLAEGTTSSTAWAPSLAGRASETSQRFAEAYRSRFQREPTDDAAYAYSAAFVIAEALRTGAQPEPQALATALRDGEFTSPQATIIPFEGNALTFDDKGQANTIILMAQAQQGRWVVVYPEQFAAAALRVGGGPAGYR